MKWTEFRDFALVALLVFNICIIVLFGHTMNKNSVRISSLGERQTNLEFAVDIGVMELGRVADDIREEVRRLSGIKVEEGESDHGKNPS